MDPNTRALMMGAAGAGGKFDPNTPIGTFIEGGYFAGLISHTADGTATHALIVAPAASGYNGKLGLKFKTTESATSGTQNAYDGSINTANMDDASHPAAQYCAGLTINSYSDWYLPARYELEIAYYNLKPTTQANNTSYGVNNYSVPKRTSDYTSGVPARTSVASFQSGGEQAFSSALHWTSTEDAANTTFAFSPNFFNGFGGSNQKSSEYLVRAFRKVAL